MQQEKGSATNRDAQLWSAVRRGDLAAFQEVVEHYQGAVSGVAFSIVGDFGVSQDVAQESFLAAWRQRSELREPQRLGGWLCGISRNLALEYRRQGAREAAALGRTESDVRLHDGSDPAEQLVSAEASEQVWRVLASLPETYREALVLFYRQGQSVAEVALTLNVSEETIRQRLHRGRGMLREKMLAMVEDALVRSRPGRSFTTRVTAAIVGATAALKSGAAVSAAPIGAAAGKMAIIPGAAGLLGGMLGAAGGLLGAWLGTWLPAQMAPTMTERRLLESRGRIMMFAAVIFTLLILVATGLVVWSRQGAAWYVGSILLTTIVFIGIIIRESLRTQSMVKRLRESIDPDEDPNPSPLRARFGDRLQPRSGYRYTSAKEWLGLPWIDIRFRGHDVSSTPPPPAVARGWIAIGDQAQGVLLGVGGVARGLIAFGGLAYGGIAIGGMTAGVFGVGGCALAGWALAGGAMGYHAAGGAALGWRSAAGGFAMARHVAFGGMAIARDFAVGGSARAASANTAEARAVADAESLKWMLEYYNSHILLLNFVILGIALLPILVLLLMPRPVSAATGPNNH